MVYSSANFNLEGKREGKKVFLTQDIFHTALNTKDLPDTISILEKELPTVFNSECFNGKGFCFKKEAESTEIGHLFEHVLLEYLKIMTEEKFGYADFRGTTRWNWKEKKGRFNITISLSEEDEEMFIEALHKSTVLLELLFSSSKEGNSKIIQ